MNYKLPECIPLTGMESLLLCSVVETVLLRPPTEEELELLILFRKEICLIYKDDPETLNQLTKLINEPPNTGI